MISRSEAEPFEVTSGNRCDTRPRRRRLTRLGFTVLLLYPAFAQPDGSGPKPLLTEADRLALLNNWVRARPLFAKAEKLFEDAGDARNALYCKISRLRADVQSMSFLEVARFLEGQLQNPIVQNDPRLRLRLLVVKGNIDMEIEPPASRRDWEEVLATARSLDDKLWQSRAQGELGIIAFFEGDSARARDMVSGAVMNAFLNGDVASQIRYLTLIGAAMADLGRTGEGLAYLDKALSIAAAKPDVPFPLLTHTARVRALARANRMTEARDALNRALARARESRVTDYEAELLVQMGILDAEANDRAAAIAHLNEGAALAARGNVYRIEASAAFELVKLYRQSREHGAAREWALRGLAAIRKVGDKYELPSHLAAIAAVEADAGRVREANALYEEATDVVEGLLVNAPSLSAKSSFVGAMSEVYLGHFKLAAEQMRSVPAAFQVLERARGRVATDALRARSIPGAACKPSATEREIASLQVALMRSDDERQRKRLLDDLFAAEQRLGAAQAGRRPGAVQVGEGPVSLRAVRRALRSDEMLLEYVLAEPASYCLAITRDSVDLVRLRGQKRIESEIGLHLKEIRSKQAAKETGRRLFGLLLEPVRGLPRRTRLVIVPDGALHGLSFDSLVDGTGRYVVESYVVSCAPSGTALDLLRTDPSRPGAGAGGLVIGGVSYEREKELLTRNAISGKQEATGGLSNLRLSALSRISHAEDEVKAITASGGKWTVLEGEAATESRLKAQPLERYQILHFATHGISDVKYPDRAALVLGWDPGTDDDGLLQAREISRLNLNAELVVLSACDTGEGRLEGEEGVANLVRAFMIAGARSVVASQWVADDTSTLALMTGFYRNLAGGYDRAAALRRAKQDFLARFGANAVPYYWAGFVLVGESATPISLQH